MINSDFIRKTARRYAQETKGAATIVYALALPAIIGLIAINVEIGHYRQQNARLQTAADMAAIAAALEYKLTDNSDQAKFAGAGDAIENGYYPPTGTINIEHPIVSGDYVGQDGFIVRITQEQKRYFSNIFKPKENIFHRVEATALLQGDGQPMCMLALDPTAAYAAQVTGSGDLQMESCAMHANSTNAAAFDLSGAGQIVSECISATGGITMTSNYSLTECKAPRPYRPKIRDPYEDLAIDYGAVAAMPCLKPKYPSKGVTQLQPGRYCGSKGIGAHALMSLSAPGTYYLDGPSLYFKAGAEFRGPSGYADNGITLVFMNGSHIENTNGGIIDLQAPQSGPFKGVLMYGDRNTSDTGKIVRLNGNQQASLEGALYFPRQKVDFRGGGDVISDCTQIVSRLIEFSGNSALTNRDCTRVGTRPIVGNGGNGVILVN